MESQQLGRQKFQFTLRRREISQQILSKYNQLSSLIKKQDSLSRKVEKQCKLKYQLQEKIRRNTALKSERLQHTQARAKSLSNLAQNVSKKKVQIKYSTSKAAQKLLSINQQLAKKTRETRQSLHVKTQKQLYQKLINKKERVNSILKSRYQNIHRKTISQQEKLRTRQMRYLQEIQLEIRIIKAKEGKMLQLLQKEKKIKANIEKNKERLQELTN